MAGQTVDLINVVSCIHAVDSNIEKLQSSQTSILISIIYPIRREVDNRLITQEQSIDLHHTQL